jgi:hypothetical protein
MWNGGTQTNPNWAVKTELPGGETLYITPTPANTTTDPSIGLVDGNEVPLPTSYNTLNVDTLNSVSINNSGNINTATINGHTADASAWSTFPAYHDVNANLVGGFPLYDINNFRTANLTNANVSDTLRVSNKTFTADCDVGNNDILNPYQGQGDLNVYGYNLLPGNNALYVSGGTTLDGGTLHGFTTGCLPVAGINTTRIDVNQTGIRIKSEVSGTYIQGAGVTGLVLKGGNTVGGYNAPIDIHGETVTVQGGTISQTSTYGTYATVEKMVIKTLDNPIELRSSKTTLMSGALVPALVSNDVTELFVGSIHGAETGDGLPCTLPLRINEARGVEISNGTTWTTNVLNATTVGATTVNATTVGATTVNATTVGATTVNATNGNFTNITTTGTAVIPYINPTIITLPEASFRPLLWNNYTAYVQYAFVYYPEPALPEDPLTLWFSILETTGTEPGTDPTTWISASWNEGATYDTGMPTMDTMDPSLGMFWLSKTNGNVGNEPFVSPDYWMPTTNYTLGYNNAGITFTKAGDETTQTWITRNVGAVLPMDITISAVDHTNYEISSGTIVTSPAYKDFNMNYKNITNLSQVLNEGDFHMVTNGTIGFNTGVGTYSDLNFVCGHSLQCFAGNSNGGGTTGNGDLKFLCGGQVEFGSYNGGSISFHTFGSTDGLVPVTQDISFEAQRDITITTDSRDIVIHSANDLSLYGAGACGYNSGTSTTIGTGTTLTANTGGAITLNPSSGGTTITSALNMSNQTITNCAGLSRAGSITLTTTGTTQNINLSPSGVVLSNKNIDLNGNSLINCASVTRTGTLALTGSTGLTATATTGTAALTASAAAAAVRGQVNASVTATTGTLTLAASAGTASLTGNTGVSVVATTGTAAVSSSAGALNLTGYTNTAVTATTGNATLEGQVNVEILADTGYTHINSALGATVVAAQTTVTLSPATGNIILSPTTGIVSATKNLDMNNHEIINCTALRRTNGALDISTTYGNITLSAAPSYSIVFTDVLNMQNNTINTCNGISSYTGSPFALTAGTTLTLTASTGDIVLSPVGVVTSNSTLDMTSHGITQVSTLNTHNLYCYASFYSTASQTLAATNTPTRVKMDATGSASGITLDSVTNIGRITFAKAGTYSVAWDAYFLHGSGGATVSNLWIRLNGTDVVASNRTIINNNASNETVLSSSSFVVVTASQYIEFYWGADGTNVPLTYIAAATTPLAKPSTPGFTCLINIVA